MYAKATESNKNRPHSTAISHTTIEDKQSYTLSEITRMYEEAYHKGYTDAQRDTDMEHNRVIENYSFW